MTIVIGIFLLLLIAVAVGLPVLIKNSKTPRVRVATTPTAAITAIVPANAAWYTGAWWIMPLVMWAILWVLVYSYFPSTWNFLWGLQPIFWITHILYAGIMIYPKTNPATDLTGRPEHHWLPGIVRFIVAALIVMMILMVVVQKNSTPVHVRSTMSSTQTHTTVTKKTTKSTTVEQLDHSEKMDSSLLSIGVTITVSPRTPCVVTIPKGYEIAPGTWSSKAMVEYKKVLEDGSTDVSFLSVDEASSTITIPLKEK